VSFSVVPKKGTQFAEFEISVCSDFKRRVRRLQFPRAAIDFSPVEIRPFSTRNWAQKRFKKFVFAKWRWQADVF